MVEFRFNGSADGQCRFRGLMHSFDLQARTVRAMQRDRVGCAGGRRNSTFHFGVCLEGTVALDKLPIDLSR